MACFRVGNAIVCGPRERKKSWPKTGEQVRDEGYRSTGRAICKACPKEIVWVKTPAGKAMPLSIMEDGRWQPHWADCPARDQFKKANGRKHADNG